VPARSRPSSSARSFGVSRTSIASGIIPMLNHGRVSADSAFVTHSLQISGTLVADGTLPAIIKPRRGMMLFPREPLLQAFARMAASG
jgi:hypothetical protein